jgi:hypothetical protein
MFERAFGDNLFKCATITSISLPTRHSEYLHISFDSIHIHSVKNNKGKMCQLVKILARLYAVFASCTAHNNTCLLTGAELWQQDIHHVYAAPDIISDSATFYTEHQYPFKGTFYIRIFLTNGWIWRPLSEEHFYYFGILLQQRRLLIHICHAENILFCDRQQRGQKVIYTLESSKGNSFIKWTT